MTLPVHAEDGVADPVNWTASGAGPVAGAALALHESVQEEDVTLIVPVCQQSVSEGADCEVTLRDHV